MPPRKILLATDLSHRCDRAMDRAAQLARQWDAGLVVLHGVESAERDSDAPSWRRGRQPRDIARSQILADLENHTGLEIEIVVERRPPAELIMETVERAGCDLVITGMARDETFGRVILGDTVQQLARRVSSPLLVVKKRPHGPYSHVIVTTDFSEGSRRGLATTVKFFAEAEITLFHAFDIIHEEYVTDKAAAREAEAARRIQTAKEFLQATPAVVEWGRPVSAMCEYGQAGPLLEELVHVRSVDLVAMGKGERNFLMRGLFGSAAERLLSRVSTDILVGPPGSA